MLRRLRRVSNRGYLSCPNFTKTLDHNQIAKGLDQIYCKAKLSWMFWLGLSSEDRYRDTNDMFEETPSGSCTTVLRQPEIKSLTVPTNSAV